MANLLVLDRAAPYTSMEINAFADSLRSGDLTAGSVAQGLAIGAGFAACLAQLAQLAQRKPGTAASAPVAPAAAAGHSIPAGAATTDQPIDLEAPIPDSFAHDLLLPTRAKEAFYERYQAYIDEYAAGVYHISKVKDEFDKVIIKHLGKQAWLPIAISPDALAVLAAHVDQPGRLPKGMLARGHGVLPGLLSRAAVLHALAAGPVLPQDRLERVLLFHTRTVVITKTENDSDKRLNDGEEIAIPRDQRFMFQCLEGSFGGVRWTGAERAFVRQTMATRGSRAGLATTTGAKLPARRRGHGPRFRPPVPGPGLPRPELDPSGNLRLKATHRLARPSMWHSACSQTST